MRRLLEKKWQTETETSVLGGLTYCLVCFGHLGLQKKKIIIKLNNPNQKAKAHWGTFVADLVVRVCMAHNIIVQIEWFFLGINALCGFNFKWKQESDRSKPDSLQDSPALKKDHRKGRYWDTGSNVKTFKRTEECWPHPSPGHVLGDQKRDQMSATPRGKRVFNNVWHLFDAKEQVSWFLILVSMRFRSSTVGCWASCDRTSARFDGQAQANLPAKRSQWWQHSRDQCC